MWSLFVPALHESAHWLAAKAWGVDGIIQLGFPLSYFRPAHYPTGIGFYVMYFAGGILVFLAYALMYSRETQLEEKAGMMPPMLMQIVYGIGEGTWAVLGFSASFYSNLVLVSNIAYFVGAVACWPFLFRFWYSLMD
jgi:hypothetical protein